jgi:lipopolysaccharide biosynthesis glycosyltransferase
MLRTLIIGFVLGFIIGKLFNWSQIKIQKGKNLVYYCISGDKNYIDMGLLSIQSMVYFLNRSELTRTGSGTDILIITQDSFKDEIKQRLTNLHLKNNGKFIIRSMKDNDINPYALRLRVFDVFPEIHSYHKVLYLDSDTVVVNKNINHLFTEYLDPKHLHVFREPGVTEYNTMFTIFPVPKDHQEYLFSRNKFPFNSGTLLFCPTQDMKNHFRNVNNLRKQYPVSHYDQDYLNYYFNVQRLLTDNEILEKYVYILDCLKTSIRTSPDKPILHFYNHTGSAQFKIKAISESVQQNCI